MVLQFYKNMRNNQPEEIYMIIIKAIDFVSCNKCAELILIFKKLLIVESECESFNYVYFNLISEDTEKY